LAGDRRSIDLERIGVNLADSETPDNEGVIEREAELVPRGPAALFATLPFGPMRAAMQAEAGDAAPVRLSLSAGSYLCNAVLYQTLFDLRFSVVRAGFLHLPPTPQMGLGFGLDVELLERVVGAGLREVVAPSGVRPN
jgi:pyroglutamyl-peptidase